MGNQVGNTIDSDLAKHPIYHDLSTGDLEDDSEAQHVHQQLVAMGFPAPIALQAAKQFPDDIGEAVDWIQNKEAIDAILCQQRVEAECRCEQKQNDCIPSTGPLHENHENIDNGYHAEYEDEDEDEEPPNNQNEPSPDPPIDIDADPENARCSISEALRAAESVVKGVYDPELSSDSMLMIAEMIGIVLSESNRSPMNEKTATYSEHEMSSFQRWTKSVDEVTLNKMYHDELCQSLLTQHDRVRNLYAFDRLNAVFQNVQRIECHHTGWVSTYFLELLLEILERIQCLEFSKLNAIHLHDINNIGSLSDFSKYQTLFELKSWKIEKGVSSLTLTRLN